MGNKRFTEYAKGNKITASGKKFSLYVKKQGNLKSLTLSDKNGSAKLRNDGTIETVSILSSKISVKLSGSGIIQSVMFGSKVSESSSSSSIEIENGSTIDTLTINFPNVTVKGPGSVKNIVVNANNANISTGNTRIVVPTGIIGTTIANKVVSGGKTYVTNAIVRIIGSGFCEIADVCIVFPPFVQHGDGVVRRDMVKRVFPYFVNIAAVTA